MLAVADTKYVHGIDDLAQAGVAFHWLPLEQAMQTAWQTDAHFVTYYPVNTQQPTFPRMNKPVLPKLRHMGADIVTQIFAFDFDNPDHVPWTDALRQQFWGLLHRACNLFTLASQCSLLYTTKAGARLVYILDQPIPVDVAEGKHRWMVAQLRAAGLNVDALSDWTRLFRLPYVMREGAASWGEGMEFLPQWHQRIRAGDLGTMEKPAGSEYREIRHFDEPKPDVTQCEDLMTEIGDTGRRAHSWWHKESRKRLRGRECFACLYEHAPLADQGSRDTTLHKYVGQAISILFRVQGTTPAHIYALFLEPVLQLEADRGTPDWTDSLWGHVGRLWVKEEAKVEVEQKIAFDIAENQLQLIDKIVAGMREWCDDIRLRADDAMAREFASHHLIVGCDGHYYIMNSSGYYDDLQVSMSNIVPRIRALGMDSIIETKVPKDNGTGWKSVHSQDIINAHSTIVSGIRGVPRSMGGYIERTNTGSATLVIPSFCRNPHLEPTYDQQVDEWLRVFFGKRYVEGCEWIAWALAFEEGPICAISIKGDPGIGKKMLARGFAETLLLPKIASPQDMVSDNQYGLLHSPFLVVDEGWPQGTGRGRHPADQFRALVSGQSFDCNRKYRAPVEVNNPVRIIFTANNLNVVQMLTAGRDLSPEDREALAIRLKHFDVGNEAATWLKLRGGKDFTGRAGRLWIQGDGGANSDFIVAKHFLWLYSEREKPIGGSGRFLVDGDTSSELMFEMRAKSGSAPVVIETIIKMLNLPTRRDGVVVQDYRLFVLTQEILEYYRSHMANSGREKLTANIVSQVFQNLIVMEHPHAMTLRDRPHLSKRRWYELDPNLLLQYARRDGWTCPVLEQLVADRTAMDIHPPVHA
jgi:hypothetical protein